MIELKKCPFCGGKAYTFHIPDNNEEEQKLHPKWRWNNAGMWVVGCHEDMCMGSINNVTMIFVTEEQAAEAWNKRA